MKSQSTADQCRAMGLAIGDTIQGREVYGDSWSDSRLTLLFLGESCAVFREQTRCNEQPEWMDMGESENWTLDCREWGKVATPSQPAGGVAMQVVCALCAVEVDTEIGIMFPFQVVARADGWVAEMVEAFNVVKQSDALAALAVMAAERDAAKSAHAHNLALTEQLVIERDAARQDDVTGGLEARLAILEHLLRRAKVLNDATAAERDKQAKQIEDACPITGSSEMVATIEARASDCDNAHLPPKLYPQARAAIAKALKS